MSLTMSPSTLANSFTASIFKGIDIFPKNNRKAIPREMTSLLCV